MKKSLSALLNSFKNKIAPHDPKKSALAQQKAWPARHYGTLMLMTGLLWFWGQTAISWLNQAPSANQQLTIYQFRVIDTNEQAPHFSVEMHNGEKKQISWPVPQNLSLQRGARFHIWSNQQRNDLVGCNATAEGHPMAWIPHEKIRIWELSCPAKNIHISRERIIDQFQRDRADRKTTDFILIGSISLLIGFVTFVVYIKEAKGHL